MKNFRLAFEFCIVFLLVLLALNFALGEDSESGAPQAASKTVSTLSSEVDAGAKPQVSLPFTMGGSDYVTNLFSGSATYSYSLEVPPGRNSLEPKIALLYNHQNKRAVSELGNSWALSIVSYIYRDGNGTVSDLTDDAFTLILNGLNIKLVYDKDEGLYHSEQETYLRIKYNTETDNWVVTGKDGVNYFFGADINSKITGSTTLKWYLTKVQDTNSNEILFEYYKDLKGDSGILYISKIKYEPGIEIKFYYEQGQYREYYDSGVKVKVTNRIKSVTTFVSETKFLNYTFSYVTQDALQLLSRIILYDSAGNNLPPVTFEYYSSQGYSNNANFLVPDDAVFGSDNSFGVRLIDFNSDGLSDILKMNNNDDLEYWINNGKGFFSKSTLGGILSGGFIDEKGYDNGVRFIDINGDKKLDIVQLLSGDRNLRKVLINNGTHFVSSDIINNIPSEVYFINKKIETVNWQDTVCYPCKASCKSGRSVADYECDINDKECEWKCKYYKCFCDGDYVGTAATSSGCLRLGDGCHGAASWTYEDCDMRCENQPKSQVITNITESGYEFIDVNNDGKVDIVYSVSGQNQKTWLNKGDVFVLDEKWSLPSEAVILGSDSKDAGTRFADINADGFIDILKGNDTKNIVWINTGNGWILSTSWSFSTPFVQSGVDTGNALFDANNDGLTDIVSGYSVLVNNGSGFITPSLLFRLPSVSFKEFSTQIADINGDGILDVIYAKQYAWYIDKRTFINDAGKNGLLKQVVASSGGKVVLDYTEIPSVNNAREDNVQKLSIGGEVVTNYTYYDGINNPYTIKLNYSDGVYDAYEREFYGFGYAEEIEPGNSTVSHWYYQDKDRKGLEYKTAIIDEQGSTIRLKSSNYTVKKKSNYAIITLDSETTENYDVQNKVKSTMTLYGYDAYGNINTIQNLGYLDVKGDDYTENISYAYNLKKWIVNVPKVITLFGFDGLKLRENIYLYDDFGNKISTEQWLNGGPNVIEAYSYDAFGNIVSYRDGRGKLYSYGYDSYGTYPIFEINPLKQKTTYSFDRRIGKATSMKDSNTYETKYSYDGFGRLVKKIFPDDSIDSPSISYSYDSYYPNGFNVQLSKIVLTDKTDGIIERRTHYYYDGFSNLVQYKKPAENYNYVSYHYKTDVFKRQYLESLPYFSDTYTYSAPNNDYYYKQAYYVTSNYDALGRVKSVYYPDNSTESYGYYGDKIVTVDSNSNKLDYIYDAYGNVAQVNEYEKGKVYTTQYKYDSSGKIVSITNSFNQKINYTYDTLGRKIRLEDPDIGIWVYEYDQNGNLLKQTDNKGNKISMTYDDLNRVKEKTTQEEKFTYVYDSSVIGRLSSVSSYKYNKTFQYDKRLRLIEEELTIDGKSFKTSHKYDYADRLSDSTLPDKDNVGYTYNSQGLIEKILGIINGVDYNEFDAPREKRFANAISVSFSYDKTNGRTLSLYSKNIQDLEYSYDNRSNIVGIKNNLDLEKESFSYDELDRLTESKKTGTHNYSFNYTYDALGNMLNASSNNKTVFFNYVVHRLSGYSDNPVICNKDLDCGKDAPVGSKFCASKDVSRQDVKKYFCVNPGTTNSYCSSRIEDRITTCASDCIAGECVKYVQCNSNAECGVSEYLFYGFCSGNDVKKIFRTYSCLNPGTEESRCYLFDQYFTIETCLNQCISGQCSSIQNITCSLNSDCGQESYTGNKFCRNNNVVQYFKSFTCVHPGTTLSTCESAQTLRTIETCTQTCSDGKCVLNQNVTCNADSDCGNSGYFGDYYCSGSNLLQNYRHNICVDPGTSKSYCAQSIYPGVRKICENSCVSGECISPVNAIYELKLQKGFNFISVMSENVLAEAFFKNSSVKAVYTWNPLSQKYDIFLPGSLLNIDTSNGLIVKTSEDLSFNITLHPSTLTYFDLKRGFNLVRLDSIPKQIKVSEFLNNTFTDCISAVYRFNPLTQKYESAVRSGNNVILSTDFLVGGITESYFIKSKCNIKIYYSQNTSGIIELNQGLTASDIETVAALSFPKIE